MDRFWICGSSRRRERKRRRQQHRLQLQQRREQIRRSGNLSETREDILHVSIEEWLSSQGDIHDLHNDGGNDDDGYGDDGDGIETRLFLAHPSSSSSFSDEDDEYYFDGRSGRSHQYHNNND